jgi:hypothetical protein
MSDPLLRRNGAAHEPLVAEGVARTGNRPASAFMAERWSGQAGPADARFCGENAQIDGAHSESCTTRAAPAGGLLRVVASLSRSVSARIVLGKLGSNPDQLCLTRPCNAERRPIGGSGCRKAGVPSRPDCVRETEFPDPVRPVRRQSAGRGLVEILVWLYWPNRQLRHDDLVMMLREDGQGQRPAQFRDERSDSLGRGCGGALRLKSVELLFELGQVCGHSHALEVSGSYPGEEKSDEMLQAHVVVCPAKYGLSVDGVEAEVGKAQRFHGRV